MFFECGPKRTTLSKNKSRHPNPTTPQTQTGWGLRPQTPPTFFKAVGCLRPTTTATRARQPLSDQRRICVAWQLISIEVHMSLECLFRRLSWNHMPGVGKPEDRFRLRPCSWMRSGVLRRGLRYDAHHFDDCNLFFNKDSGELARARTRFTPELIKANMWLRSVDPDLTSRVKAKLQILAPFKDLMPFLVATWQTGSLPMARTTQVPWSLHEQSQNAGRKLKILSQPENASECIDGTSPFKLDHWINTRSTRMQFCQAPEILMIKSHQSYKTGQCNAWTTAEMQLWQAGGTGPTVPIFWKMISSGSRGPSSLGIMANMWITWTQDPHLETHRKQIFIS